MDLTSVLAAAAGTGAGPAPSLLWAIPFVLLLAGIAAMPFVHRHWWEKWYPAVAIGLGAVAAAYYLFLSPAGPGQWLHGMQDYVGFIALLGSLFVVSGGIVINVNRKATPASNCVLLLLGAVIANFFGTTGASMLLIRPYLRMNKGHLRPYHVVFFIFLVSNVGGLLTPIGDPPLFLGYLKGVPFWWVLEHCRWPWLVTVGVLLAVFFVIDKVDHGRTTRRGPEDPGPAVSILGIFNLLFIAAIVWAVFQPGLFELLHERHEGTAPRHSLLSFFVCREVLMVTAAAVSLLLTSRRIYQHNGFTWAPIREVAILFIGIFSTMAPALQWLGANAERLPVKTPGQFYFMSGGLSSVLDNAPTYLTFLELELGKLDEGRVDAAVAEVRKMGETGTYNVDPALDGQTRAALSTVVEYHPEAIKARTVTRDQVKVAFLLGDPALNVFVVAISMGSVLFGACTYIGNGPNFMVKSIADAAGVETPTFPGYVLRYALPVLIPTYALVWLIFVYR